MKKFVKRSVFLFAAVLLFLCIHPVTAQAEENETIQKGVFAGDIDLSGMTTSEASTAIEKYIASLKEKKLTLVGVKGSEIATTVGELGLEWSNPEIVESAAALGTEGNIVARYKALKDLEHENMVYPINIVIDNNTLQTLLTEKGEQYNVAAVDASLSRVDGAFVVKEGEIGYKLDVDASVDSVSDYIETQWDHDDAAIDLIVTVDEPRGSAEDFSKVKDVIGTYSTSYATSGSNRCANVANGCKLINGATLYPGDTFSIGEAVTPFTEANGYYLAGSYLNGQVVDSLGGGICQVSTTLYNAVLLAELQVDERSNHSMIVSYVDPSADAAIAVDSGKDFKFTNNTEYPIYIEGYTQNKNITFTIYGVETRASNRKVSYESVVLEKNVPDTEQIFTDGSQPIGYVTMQSAHIGYKAQLWKVVTVNGEQTERTQVNSSTYKMVPRQATFGTATTDPNAYNTLMAAIATNNIDYTKEIAAALAAGQTQAESTDPNAVPGAETIVEQTVDPAEIPAN